LVARKDRIGGGNHAAQQEREPVTLADLCLILGILFAFGTLVPKIIGVARTR
jgi:hypothetical protein